MRLGTVCIHWAFIQFEIAQLHLIDDIWNKNEKNMLKKFLTSHISNSDSYHCFLDIIGFWNTPVHFIRHLVQGICGINQTRKTEKKKTWNDIITERELNNGVWKITFFEFADTQWISLYFACWAWHVNELRLSKRDFA